MQWQEEQSLQDVAMRDQNRPDTGFLSWSSYIKKHKDDPIKRYEVAQEFLPWPLGFKESVLALRAIIREKKKADIDYEPELLALYKLAVWDSFCPKYSDRVGENGFKVFDALPGGKVTSLEIDYQKVGYSQLKLLTKTDIKMLVALYGEPKQHSTLNELYTQQWIEAEDSYLAVVESEQEQTKGTKPPSQRNLKRAGLSSASGIDLMSVNKRIKKWTSSQPSKQKQRDNQYDVQTIKAKQKKIEQATELVKQLIDNKIFQNVLLGIKSLAYRSRLFSILNTGRLVITRKDSSD